MKTLILVALAAFTFALNGGAYADRGQVETNSTFPEGSISQPE